MIRSIYIAATGMAAQQGLVDNTANNIANVSTTGFKTSELAFQDLIYQTPLQPGTQQIQGVTVPTGLQYGLGVIVAGNEKIFTQGNLASTGNPLDLAIQGNGFFQVTYPDGTLRYTRDGHLQLSTTGALVTSNGYPISPAISIPTDATSVAIGLDGSVAVTTSANPTSSTTVGQLTLASFPNPAGLSSQGNDLYLQTAASGSPLTSNPGLNGVGTIQQGYLEGSNVNVVSELVNLILAQRSYEFNTRTVRVSDEMLSTTTGLIT